MDDCIDVRSRETGEVISIRACRFNPEIHAHLDEDVAPIKKAVLEEEDVEGVPCEGNICESCAKEYKTEAALKAHNTRDHSE